MPGARLAEICWDEEGPRAAESRPGSGLRGGAGARVAGIADHPFGVAVPATGREIVAHPDDMNKADSPDPFNRWVATLAA